MSVQHLKQPRFSYSGCGPFTKHRERIQKSTEIGNLKHVSRNESNKVSFPHDAAYSDSKDTISDKILKNKAYEITRNRKHDVYERALASMGYKVFDQKTRFGVSVNEKLAEELHKPVIKKFKKRIVYARFTVNTLAADLAEIGSLSSKNKNIKYCFVS